MATDVLDAPTAPGAETNGEFTIPFTDESRDDQEPRQAREWSHISEIDQNADSLVEVTRADTGEVVLTGEVRIFSDMVGGPAFLEYEDGRGKNVRRALNMPSCNVDFVEWAQQYRFRVVLNSRDYEESLHQDSTVLDAAA